MKGKKNIQSEKGTVTIEFSMLVIMMVVMLFGIVEFGAVLQAQAVVTNVTREGASIASRDIKTDSDLVDYLTSSSAPLDFDTYPERFKIYIAKVDASDSEGYEPTCTVQEAGSLTGVAVLPLEMKSPAESSTCDLTETLYDYLRFDPVIGTSPISQFTVVKVFYQHQTVTPLESFLEGSVLNFDSDDPDSDPDSILISSKAVF